MPVFRYVRLFRLEVEGVIASRQEPGFCRLFVPVDEHDVGIVFLGEVHGFVDIEGFRQVLGGTGAERLEGVVRRGVGGDDDEGWVIGTGPGVFQDLESGAVRKLEIAHHEVEAGVGELLDAGGHRLRSGDLVALLLEQQAVFLETAQLDMDVQPQLALNLLGG